MVEISRILESDVPDYVTKFDKLILTGEPYQKNYQGSIVSYYRLDLSFPSADGSGRCIGLDVPKEW